MRQIIHHSSVHKRARLHASLITHQCTSVPVCTPRASCRNQQFIHKRMRMALTPLTSIVAMVANTDQKERSV